MIFHTFYQSYEVFLWNGIKSAWWNPFKKLCRPSEKITCQTMEQVKELVKDRDDSSWQLIGLRVDGDRVLLKPRFFF